MCEGALRLALALVSLVLSLLRLHFALAKLWHSC